MAVSSRLTELSASIRERVESQVPPGPRAVALSGGADSAVLLWATRGSATRALHVDHGLAASPVLEQAALAIADHLEVPFQTLRVQVPIGASPEGQARDVRYAALLSELNGSESLLTGHTSDDQAETVLGNMLRGSGIGGLAGIPTARGQIVRPLLGVTRSETRELAELLALPWFDDPTNELLDVRRNSLRRSVIPNLEARFNPALRSQLSALAGRMRNVADDLAAYADQVSVVHDGSELRLPIPLLLSVPRSVADEVIRRSLRSVRGPHSGTASELDRIWEVLQGSRGPSAVADGVRVEKRTIHLVLTSDQAVSESVGWRLPGTARFGSWLLDAWIDTDSPTAIPLDGWLGVLDADLVGDFVTIRSALASDRLGSTLVHERWRAAGVAVEDRSHRPVLERKAEIVWAPNGGTSPSVWVSRETRRYLWVNARRENW